MLVLAPSRKVLGQGMAMNGTQKGGPSLATYCLSNRRKHAGKFYAGSSLLCRRQDRTFTGFQREGQWWSTPEDAASASRANVVTLWPCLDEGVWHFGVSRTWH